jgi:hypothetical protein
MNMVGKIWDIPKGNILIATDIHGNWEDYQQIKHRFEDLYAKGHAQGLIFTGDLIHGYPGYEDKSIEILDDIITTRDPRVCALLGNHELAHIYHIDIAKNGLNPVERLEDAFEERQLDREKYIRYFKELPIVLRTAGGVTITHSGANAPMAGYSKPAYNGLIHNDQGLTGFDFIHSLDHDVVLNEIKALTRQRLEEENGFRLDQNYFDDFTPALGDTFLNSDIGAYLWDVLFNQNEHQYTHQYPEVMNHYLQTMSRGIEQKWIISGHLVAPNGYETLGPQLRISSSYGAKDNEHKVMALIDASKEYASMRELTQELVRVYEPEKKEKTRKQFVLF